MREWKWKRPVPLVLVALLSACDGGQKDSAMGSAGSSGQTTDGGGAGLGGGDGQAGGAACDLEVGGECQAPWVKNVAVPRLAIDDAYVYTSDISNSVGRIDKQTGEAGELATIERCSGLAVDESHLYVTVISVSGEKNGGVVRFPKDGGPAASESVEPLLQDMEEGPKIAVDGDSLFVAERLAGTIWELPKSGGEPFSLVSGGQMWDVAAGAGELYWYEWLGNASFALMRLDLAGSDLPETIASEDLGPPLLTDDAVYFMNDLSGNVYRAPRTGGEPSLVLQTVSDQVHRGVGLAVGGGFIYVKTSDARLLRATIGGQDLEELARSELLEPRLVADEDHLYFVIAGQGVYRTPHRRN